MEVPDLAGFSFANGLISTPLGLSLGLISFSFLTPLAVEKPSSLQSLWHQATKISSISQVISFPPLNQAWDWVFQGLRSLRLIPTHLEWHQATSLPTAPRCPQAPNPGHSRHVPHLAQRGKHPKGASAAEPLPSINSFFPPVSSTAPGAKRIPLYQTTPASTRSWSWI